MSKPDKNKRRFSRRFHALQTRAQGIVIRSEEDYLKMDRLLTENRQAMGEVDGLFDPIIQREQANLDATKGDKAEYRQPFEQLEDTCKPIMREWNQKRIALEKAAIDKECEALLKVATKERDRQIKQALKAGDKATARQLKSEDIVIPRRPISRNVEGSTMSHYEKKAVEIIDLEELVKAIAKGTVPLRAVKPDITFLNNQANSLKEEMRYPGVKVVPVPVDAKRNSSDNDA